MKRLLILLFSILLFGFVQKGDKTYYPTGELESEIIYDENDRMVQILVYYKDGSRRTVTNYANGSIHGASIHYFPNGKISVYTVYQDGVPHGRAYSNFNNGKLAYEEYYDNNYKTDTSVYYNEDGSIRIREIHQPYKTKFGDRNDYKTAEHFLDNRLAYIETIEEGQRTDLKIAEQKLYDRLLAKNKSTGKKLFMANCGMCHMLERDAVGPALANITELRNKEWLRKMIRNGYGLVQSKDSLAVSLYNKWERVEHTGFEALSDEDIDNILAFTSKK